jgi:hypothetical protein
LFRSGARFEKVRHGARSQRKPLPGNTLHRRLKQIGDAPLGGNLIPKGSRPSL